MKSVMEIEKIRILENIAGFEWDIGNQKKAL